MRGVQMGETFWQGTLWEQLDHGGEMPSLLLKEQVYESANLAARLSVPGAKPSASFELDTGLTAFMGEVPHCGRMSFSM